MKRVQRIPVDHLAQTPWQEPGEELGLRPMLKERIQRKRHHASAHNQQDMVRVGDSPDYLYFKTT